jgi:hypothetical protein
MNIEAADLSFGLQLGGSTASAATCSQTVNFIEHVVILEDARPAFNVIAEDEFAVGSFTTSAASTQTNLFATNYPNEVLLAFVAVQKDTQTVSSISWNSLTWVNVGRTNTQNGSVEVWRAFAPTPLVSGTALTVNFSASIVSANYMVIGLVGADITGSNGSGAIGATGTASGTSSTPTVSLTTTRNNSWVWGVYNDPSEVGSLTAGANQTRLRIIADATNTVKSCMQRQNAITAASGTSVTINSTTSMAAWNIFSVEILPAITHGLSAAGAGT